MSWKTLAWMVGGYALAGVAVVGWTAYLGEQGKPHFRGLGSVGSVGGVTQAFLLWPVAAVHNVVGP